MDRLSKYLEVVERRIVNPFGPVNSAALARLIRKDIPRLKEIIWRAVQSPSMLSEVEGLITDEDLKVWGHPVEEALYQGADANLSHEEGESPPF